jgi:DNA-binding SARP family transcriptional activator
VDRAATDRAEAALLVLGRFEVRVGERPVAVGANGQRVLAYLAVAGPCQRRETLAGRLWEWSSQARAQANLRNALWRINQVDRCLVEATRDEVRLSDGLRVDLHISADHARRLIDGDGEGPPPAVPRSLLESDILPDMDEDWLLLERERHRQLRIHALEALSTWLVAAGRFVEAIDAAYAAIVAEPLRESAHGALIRAHVAEGNRGEAARQFRVYERLLRDELGLRPSPQIAALVTPEPLAPTR